MYCKVLSGTAFGIGGLIIQVEVDVSDGLPAFCMVGMLSSEVKEAGERVRTALKNSGYKIPPKRITVNLSPAYIRKVGSAFDLPIAAAVLANLGFISRENLNGVLIIGELGLDGTVNMINGVLPVVCAAESNNAETVNAEFGVPNSADTCIVPAGNVMEASVTNTLKVIGVSTLRDMVDYFNGRYGASSGYTYKNEKLKYNKSKKKPDFADVSGQYAVKRAAEIAAAGMHNFLMIGPPGSGKTMIACRIPSIMPDMSFEESIEVTKIYSIAGKLDKNNPLVTERPFRSPHHTVTAAAMAGGGKRVTPGEITLANRGVLFLDELPEFSMSALEILRQPLENGKIEISRVYGNYSYPAQFMLIGAMNPCKCGYYPDMSKCTCTREQIKKYLGRISRPLLDRIDISIEVSKTEFSELVIQREEEDSATIKERVEAARKIQQKRYGNNRECYNGKISFSQIKEFCRPDKECRQLMEKAYERLGLTARSYHKVLKVARTIADLSGEDIITKKHISEALIYKGNTGEEFWSGMKS